MRSLNPDKVAQLPIWRAIPALFTLLLGWLLLGELAARTPLASQLPPPSTGADSFEFDLKVFYLEQSLRTRGPLDCIIVGDSMANDGPDPILVEQTYTEITGTPLHCFNFGMPALTLEASAPLAETLANRYHPRLLIFMLSPRDFVPEFGAPYAHVATSAWTRQNSGQKSIKGWAANYLYGYRYFLFMRYWLNPENRETYTIARQHIEQNGFTPLYGFRKPAVTYPPQPNYSLADPAAMKGFERLLALSSHQNLLIIDAPVSPKHYQIYLQTPEGYISDYVQPMQAEFAPLGIPFWLTKGLSESIPDEAWHDALHVNEKGVPILSGWMGQQLAKYYPPEFFK